MESIFDSDLPDFKILKIENIGKDFCSITLNKIPETIINKSKIQLQHRKLNGNSVYWFNDIKISEGSWLLMKEFLINNC